MGTFALLALLAPRLAAADSSTAEPEWEARIYGFAWLPALYSHPSIGPFTTNINVTADDLFRHFRWGVAAGLEDRYREFLLLADGMAVQYTAGVGNPVQNFPVSPGGTPGTVSTGPSDAGLRSTIMMLEGALGWRPLSKLISPESPDDNRRFRLDLLLGPRLWYFRNKLSITIPPARITVGGVMVPVTSVMLPREVTLGRTTLPGIFARDGLNTVIEETTSWVDAVIGFRASVDVSRAVSLSLRGDVGGFSIGNSSTFTWQVLPALEWRFTEHWSFGLAWRTIAIKKGRADDTIIYGLDVGAGYRF